MAGKCLDVGNLDETAFALGDAQLDLALLCRRKTGTDVALGRPLDARLQEGEVALDPLLFMMWLQRAGECSLST